MKEYGKFKVFTQIRAIKEIQTMLPHYADQIRLHPSCKSKTAEFATSIYNPKTGKWDISYQTTEADCIKYIGEVKSLAETFPEVFGSWATDYSDMYIFESNGYRKSNWGLRGIVVEM